MGLNYKFFGAWLRCDISAGAGLHGQVELSLGRKKKDRSMQRGILALLEVRCFIYD
jgi:hypothetical protein